MIFIYILITGSIFIDKQGYETVFANPRIFITTNDCETARLETLKNNPTLDINLCIKKEKLE